MFSSALEIVFYIFVFIAPPHYAMEYEKQDSERQLKCSAFLGYPKPNIIWQDCCISREDTRTERTQDGLYSVRSEKNITDKAYSYVCHIQFGDQIWTADWKRAGGFELFSIP